MELKDTVRAMTSPDYIDRFLAEYHQLDIRTKKLRKFLNRITASEHFEIGEVEHDCPKEVLLDQLEAMEKYKSVLELRAAIEDVDLEQGFRYE